MKAIVKVIAIAIITATVIIPQGEVRGNEYPKAKINISVEKEEGWEEIERIKIEKEEKVRIKVEITTVEEVESKEVRVGISRGEIKEIEVKEGEVEKKEIENKRIKFGRVKAESKIEVIVEIEGEGEVEAKIEYRTQLGEEEIKERIEVEGQIDNTEEKEEEQTDNIEGKKEEEVREGEETIEESEEEDKEREEEETNDEDNSEEEETTEENEEEDKEREEEDKETEEEESLETKDNNDRTEDIEEETILENNYKNLEINKLKPVYRFFNGRSHFYTISEREKEHIEQNLREWKNEGKVFYVYGERKEGTRAVHRYLNKRGGNHFYTISSTEKSILDRSNDWKYEGIVYYAYETKVAKTEGVHRYWSGRGHFYTIDRKEKEKVDRDLRGWAYEGIKYYAVEEKEYIKNRIGVSHIGKYKTKGEEYCGTYKYEIKWKVSNILYSDRIYNKETEEAYDIEVGSKFRETYYGQRLGGIEEIDQCRELGIPEMNKESGARSPQGTTGEYQGYERGSIYKSSHGTYVVYGKIEERHKSRGGTGGRYGYPRGKMYREVSQNMICQEYEGGKLCEEDWAVCGNGKVEGRVGEVCDDGNTNEGDRCSSDCRAKCPERYRLDTNNKCVREFLGSIHPLARDSNCVNTDKVYSGPNGDDDFGPRTQPINHNHDGVDIRKKGKGSCLVNAVANGVVYESALDTLKANYIDIKHGKYITRYLHGQNRLLNEGDKVDSYNYVFNMGCTGICTGTHLHFGLLEVKKGENNQDITIFHDPQNENYFGYLGGILEREESRDYLPDNLDEETTIYKITKRY